MSIASLSCLAALIGTQAPALSSSLLPAGEYGWLGELGGHCWSSDHPDGTRDTQCYTVQYGRFLRGTIEIAPTTPEAAREPYRGDSIFYRDGDSGQMTVHYWSNSGAHGVMTGRVVGERIIFTGLPRNGAPAATRTIWTRMGADSFRVVQQRRVGDAWADAIALTYRRSGAAPAAP